MKGIHLAGMMVSAGLILVDLPVFAAEPFADFTFKRVKPPAQGTQKRITIQVLAPIGSAKGKPDAAPTPSGSAQKAGKPRKIEAPMAPDAWFWASISPALSDAAPGRFERAARVLSSAPADKVIQAPRLEEMRALATQLSSALLLATVGRGLSPALILAILAVEARNPPGRDQLEARVIAQLSSRDGKDGDALAEIGFSGPPSPARHIESIVKTLEQSMERLGGDPILALAAYRAGLWEVVNQQGVPPDHDVRRFVPEVINAFMVARALCQTPPELYSDGCVFLQ